MCVVARTSFLEQPHNLLDNVVGESVDGDGHHHSWDLLCWLTFLFLGTVELSGKSGSKDHEKNRYTILTAGLG